jgi:hypothetical protein
MADVKDSVFPTSHREAMFTVAALHQWGHDEPPVEDTRCVTTADYWINEVIHTNSPGGPLPCVSGVESHGSSESSESPLYDQHDQPTRSRFRAQMHTSVSAPKCTPLSVLVLTFRSSSNLQRNNPSPLSLATTTSVSSA